jgi:PBP1b-binding outer membrane lipoprotein LpoB
MNSKYLLIILSLLLLNSCSKNPETYIEHLEGYWEIEEVVLPDGTKKSYTYNDTIDYIKVSDSLTGFRIKLKPRIDGTYETSKDSEQFTIKIENDSLNLYYKTSFDSWKETILLANEEQLKVINKNKAVFLYKKFIPINLN